MNDGLNHDDQPPTHQAGSTGGTRRHPDVITHLALALSRYVRELRHACIPVPAEIEELTAFLTGRVRSRQEATALDDYLRAAHHAGVAGQLLVSKAEAAERLCVSVRTIERLVAAGQLRMVHVERAARLRVADLEAYVHNLAEDRAPQSDSGHPP